MAKKKLIKDPQQNTCTIEEIFGTLMSPPSAPVENHDNWKNSTYWAIRDAWEAKLKCVDIKDAIAEGIAGAMPFAKDTLNAIKEGIAKK